MKIHISLNKHSFGFISVTREESDPKVYSESLLLYRLKLALNKKSFDLIKKRMWKDGHMMGGDDMQYLRSRNRKAKPGYQIFDGRYALRLTTEDFNNFEEVKYDVVPLCELLQMWHSGRVDEWSVPVV